MNVNYLEDQFVQSNLFIHEEYLEINFLPQNFIHREQELMILSKIFINIIENPFAFSRKVMIQGDIGLGKTALAQYFSKMLLSSSKKRGLNIIYVHINCRKERTSYKILHQILVEIGCNVPNRGFSPQELAGFIQDYLIKNNIYVLLTLDELNFLDNTKFDLIYTLTRFGDNPYNKQNLSLITIVKDITFLKNLDDSSISTLQGTILTLKKYSKSQIFDILNERIKNAVKPGVFSNRIIQLISDLISDSGDIRKGLNIIRNAIKLAETLEKSIVSEEDIFKSLENMLPTNYDESINFLNLHQLLMIKSLLKVKTSTELKIIPISMLRSTYIQLCHEIEEIPRSTTQFWEYIQFLKNNSLIEVEIKSKNNRGRTSYISLNNIPEKGLEEKIQHILQRS